MISIIIILGKNHDIAVGGVWVDSVLLSANIVRRIVDMKDVMEIHAVVLE